MFLVCIRQCGNVDVKHLPEAVPAPCADCVSASLEAAASPFAALLQDAIFV